MVKIYDPEEAGKQACSDGLLCSNNPHDKIYDTRNAMLWNKGYTTEQNKMQLEGIFKNDTE